MLPWRIHIPLDLAGNQFATTLLRAPERIERDNYVGEQGNGIRQRKAARLFRNETHQRRQNSSPDNRHHEKRPAQLRIWPETFQSERKNCWKHERHEKAGEKNAPQTHPAGGQHSDGDKNNICDAVGAHELAWIDEAHQPGGGKSADAKGSQRSSQKIAGDLFGLMGILLNERDEIAPRAHLCADVEELRYHREKKMRIAE